MSARRTGLPAPMPVPPASVYQRPPAKVLTQGPVPRWLDPRSAAWPKSRVRAADVNRTWARKG
jgi:hypothetical protein